MCFLRAGAPPFFEAEAWGPSPVEVPEEIQRQLPYYAEYFSPSDGPFTFYRDHRQEDMALAFWFDRHYGFEAYEGERAWLLSRECDHHRVVRLSPVQREEHLQRLVTSPYFKHDWWDVDWQARRDDQALISLLADPWRRIIAREKLAENLHEAPHLLKSIQAFPALQINPESHVIQALRALKARRVYHTNHDDELDHADTWGEFPLCE